MRLHPRELAFTAVMAALANVLAMVSIGLTRVGQIGLDFSNLAIFIGGIYGGPILGFLIGLLGGVWSGPVLFGAGSMVKLWLGNFNYCKGVVRDCYHFYLHCSTCAQCGIHKSCV